MKLLRYVMAAAVLAALAVSPSAFANHAPDHNAGATSPGEGGAGNANPGQGNPNPGQGNPNPGQGNPDPGQGNPDPGQGNPNPGQGNPGQGNPNPGQNDGEPPHGVAAGHDKIAICHATLSETNPFAIIEIPRQQWDKGVGHGGHPGDFPLPADGQCEGHEATQPAIEAALEAAAGNNEVVGDVGTTTEGATEGATLPGEQVLGAGMTQAGTTAGETVGAGVLASHQDAPNVAADRTTGALPFTGTGDKELLFTGFGLSLILIGIGSWGLTKPAKVFQS